MYDHRNEIMYLICVDLLGTHWDARMSQKEFVHFWCLPLQTQAEENGGMRQTSLPCVHVWLHEWYESTSCTAIETKRCTPLCAMDQNADWNILKIKLN